jgi:hypothetical protein
MTPRLIVAALTLTACAYSGITPRFDAVTAAGFAQEPMRRLQTAHVEMYYPESHRETAERIASRLDECVVALRAKARPDYSHAKILVYLTLANFNNAFVQAEYAGAPLQMVLPVHTTLETDNFLDFGTVNEGNTACHEALHYVQNEQTHGIWKYVNTVAGALVTPSQGLERWFTEGLAVWTEGHIGLRTARPESPFWRGVFEGSVEERGYRMRAGDLSIATRDLYGSGAYLTGYYFIDYLVRTYGEEKIWDLIESEGGSVLSTIAVTLRFDQIYGKTLGHLFDDFSEELFQKSPGRARPASQAVLHSDEGAFARLGVGADGSRAVVSDGYDTPSALRVYERDGSVRFTQALTKLLPGRRWINVQAGTISGLRFSSDGRTLYLVASGLTVRGDDGARLWALDAHTGASLRSWELSGFGGDISPDGRSYAYIQIDHDTAALAQLDLASGARTVLTHLGAARSLGAPAYSPDGRRIAFPVWNGESFDLAVRGADGAVTLVTTDGRSNYGPRWLDDHRLVFMREQDGRWQLHTIDLETQAMTRISDAPHLAIDPMPLPDGRVAFLNRDGVRFTVDAVPLSGGFSLTPSPPPKAPEPVPSAQIVSDEPYSRTDGLFVPILHTPFLALRSDPVKSHILTGGLALSGSDRLGYHNYALNISTDTATRQVSFAFEYGLHAFAPVFALLHVERSLSYSGGYQADYRELSLNVGRRFWDWPVSLEMAAIDKLDNVSGRTRLVGPGLVTSYSAGEYTPYGGLRRGIRLGGAVAAYPAALGSSANIASLRGNIGFTLPLPFSARHNLSFDLVGRTLPGASTGVLQVGGGSGYFLGPTCSPNCSFGSGDALPGSIYFVEPLRGYEDTDFLTNRVAIGTVRYRYPLIIDRGLTAVFYALPSLWVSQINVELFGTAAFIEPRTKARAVGGAVTLYTLWGQAVPVSVGYQFAFRFDEHLPPLHLVTLVY